MAFQQDGTAPAGYYRLTIYKYRSGAPEKMWVNSYEYFFPQSLAFSDIITLTQTFVDFEKAFHLNSIWIDRAVIASWDADSTPYNANEFITIPLNQRCARFPSGDPLPLEVVVYVRKAVRAGFPGKLLYRGCLAENEISAPAGSIQFSNPAFQSLFASSLPALADYLAGGDPTLPKLCLITSPTQTASFSAREVVAFQLVSPRIRSRSSRYYRRAP